LLSGLESLVAGVFFKGGPHNDGFERKSVNGRKLIEVDERGSEIIINHSTARKNWDDLLAINTQNTTIEEHIRRNRPELVDKLTAEKLEKYKRFERQTRAFDALVVNTDNGGDIIREMRAQTRELTSKLDATTEKLDKTLRHNNNLMKMIKLKFEGKLDFDPAQAGAFIRDADAGQVVRG
jgi:hypothetical protein